MLHLQQSTGRGGCEVDCEHLIRHAPELRHVVVVLAESGVMSGRWAAAGAEVLHWPILGSKRLGFYRRLRAGVRGLGARHAIAWAPIRVPWLLGALRGTVESVLLHAGNPLPPRVLREAEGLICGPLLGQPPRVAVVACSEQVAEDYQRHAYLRRFPCFACFNPIELPPAAHAPRMLDPAGPVRIGMVARLDRIKDHATVLRAFAEVRRAWPQAVLEFAGDGELRADLERQAAALGIRDAVVFHGFVGDVPGLLAQWDLFVYGTTRWEGLGNALAEAMAHGLPCVVTDLPVTRELAGTGDAVVFVPAGDPAAMAAEIPRVLTDPASRIALGQAARARIAARFDPARIAAYHRELLGIDA